MKRILVSPSTNRTARTSPYPHAVGTRWDSLGELLRIPRMNHRSELAGALATATALLLPAQTVAGSVLHPAASRFQTSRVFHLGRGHAMRTFSLHERSGVILVNRLTVPHGVHAFVEARIPRVAGARVSSWPDRNDPSLACRRHGRYDVCTQSEEWCPMPQATWHVHLVKLSGPAGAIRFDYVVAAPPPQR